MLHPETRVLVTGGSGFLGTAVLAALSRHGARTVFAPASDDYDLRKQDQVARMFSATRPDIVIHLAAVVGGIGANRAFPGRFFYENAVMGVETLHQAHLHGVAKFVGIGTICEYPKFTPAPFREEWLWDGYPEETNAPYGLAKKMMLVQGNAYRAQYGFNAIHLLLVNLYGPGDNFDIADSHVIPALVRRMVHARNSGDSAIRLWGDGTPTREFLYVDDAADAIVLAAAHYDKAAPVNVGSGQEISIRDLADEIAAATGYVGAIEWDSSQPNGQPRRLLDTTRATAEFGFVATTPFAEGLAATVRWFEENHAAGA